ARPGRLSPPIATIRVSVSNNNSTRSSPRSRPTTAGRPELLWSISLKCARRTYCRAWQSSTVSARKSWRSSRAGCPSTNGTLRVSIASAERWTRCPSSTPRFVVFDDRDLFDAEVGRLRHAVAQDVTLNDLETARVLFLSELAFGSDLLGAGVEFQLLSPMRDDEGIVVLRHLQRKLYTRDGAKALFRTDLY